MDYADATLAQESLWNPAKIEERRQELRMTIGYGTDRDDEMPPIVYSNNDWCVNYLVGQVLNGGFLQFIQNSNWEKNFVEGVHREGLRQSEPRNILP